jgi:stage V sporulation protein D (sporulation-specific penicillin-binding protein)
MARRNRRPTWRLFAVMVALVIATGGIVLRLIQVQVVDHQYYAAQAQDEHLHQTTVHAARGAILDRNGYPLATSVSTFDVYIDPRTWKDDGAALAAASKAAPLLNRSVAELITAVRAQQQGDYIAARQVSATVGLRLMTNPLAGVKTVESSSRYYPEGDIASNILGFIGLDQTGLAGVESDFDRELGGLPGLVYFERDGLGNPIPFGQKVGDQPKAGGDVVLTIDRYIQQLVEQELDAQVKQHGASGGTIIVMDPATGQVLAMASRPTFKLSQLNLSDPAQAELYRNRAVTDLYEPGSVMKTITMASAIDQGLVNPDTTYYDSGEANIDGSVIKNWDFSSHGTTTMRQVLQYSLNTGAVWLSGQLGPDRLYDYMKRFGFGTPAGMGLAGEPAGIVRTNHDVGWSTVDLATNSFGQGISVTPVQMLTAISALVNGGRLMRPYIVKEVTGPDGDRVYQPVVVRQAVSEETSRTLVQMMEAVVDGQPGHLAQVPGYTVGGKTGTTTFPNSSNTLASFVGFSPVSNPKFIMLARIDSPQDASLGGVVAAPIFHNLAPKILAYMSVAPDKVDSSP